MQKHVAIWSRGANFRPKKPRGVQRTPPASLRVKIQIGWGGDFPRGFTMMQRDRNGGHLEVACQKQVGLAWF